MELYQLEQFVAIAECGSMAAAAERLFVSRAALSQSLKRLESELGVSLFSREHNRLEITSYGEILLDHAKKISSEVVSLHEGIDREKQLHGSLVRVGHFSLPLSHFKMPHLAQELSELTFEVEVSDAASLCEGLANGEFDLIVVPSTAKLPGDALSVDVESERACLSVPENSRLYGRSSVKLSELVGEKLFLTDNLVGMSEWYGELAAASGVDRSDIEVVDSGRYLNTMSGNDCCHFSTDQMVNFFGLGNGRMAVEIEDDMAVRTVVAAYRRESRELVAPVIDYLRSSSRPEYGSYDIFPYLMFPGQIGNLTFT